MPIIIDEETRQRILVDEFTTDIIYTKRNPDSLLTDESVRVIGPWKDYTGSKLAISTRNLLSVPRTANQLEGTDPAIQGEVLPNLNEVGQNTAVYRRRRKRVYKQIKKNI